MISISLEKVLKRFEGVFDTLVDARRGNSVMALLLSCYAIVWALIQTIAKSSQDIHPDMAEMAAWSRTLELGTPKHPPMGSWLLHFWFDVFPKADWSFYLFAAILAAFALWVSWRVSQRYMPRDKCVFGIALLTLVPFYNFHALKFNANSVLTPLWALATWWFLLSFEVGTIRWAVLAGVAAAATLLGKYWSVILLLSFGLAAFLDRRRDKYFDSPAPYISLAVATILITPNLGWVIEHEFAPLNYAFEAHPASYLTALKSTIYFLVASLCYAAIPACVVLLAIRPGKTALTDVVSAPEPERRLVLIVFATPFLLATLVALLLEVRVESLWAISTMTLLPVVLLASPLVRVSRKACVAATATAIVFPLLMIVTAPIFAAVSHRNGVDNSEDQYALIAGALKTAWQKQSNEPLRVIGSYSSVVNGAAFYLKNEPLTFDLFAPATTPWVDDAAIRHYGMAMICPETIYTCLRILDGYADHYDATSAESISLSRRYLGRDGAALKYKVIVIPPRH